MDRLGARVDAELRQLLAQRDDLVLEPIGGAMGDPLRRPRPRSDRLITAVAESADDLADPALGDAVGLSDSR
jgi:hypothetical protein